MVKSKTFLDTVHGYITVPETFCDYFIDTPNFQRLRRIEQLSSRSLFPCARHDRFVHSIGVYQIGKKLVEAIRRNGTDIEPSLENSFLIACLLHDVGHSPFSHTLEQYFGTTKELFEVYKDALKQAKEDDKVDDINVENTDVKQHEILSALLCIIVYCDFIKLLDASPALVGRMIMGFPYGIAEKSLEDCFISLLHGDVIDADKLDYVCRDSWASGYQSNSVDVERIISSIMLYKTQEGKYKIAYFKNALYDIHALIENKNFQSNWIFKHHQVIYEQKIFKDAIVQLVKCLQPDGKMSAQKLFNYKSFYEETEVCQGTSIYMLSDDDIVHLMKIHKDKIPSVEEWMSRQYRYTPIWKTYSEMIAMLGEEVSDKVMKDEGGIYDDIICYIKKIYNKDAFALNSTPSVKSIKKGQVDIYYDANRIVDFTELGMPHQKNDYEGRTFKYIYVEKTLFDTEPKVDKEDVIENIKSFVEKYNYSHLADFSEI